MKKTPYQRAKNRLDIIYSEYIRKRDCLKTSDNFDGGLCYTCGKYKPYSELEAGHFIKRERMATRWDDRNVHAQCTHCNLYLRGNIHWYYKKLEEEYGSFCVEKLMKLEKTIKKYSLVDIEEKIKITRLKINKL